MITNIELQIFFLKRANPGLFLCLFLSFPNDTIQIHIDKSVDGVLRAGQQDRRGR